MGIRDLFRLIIKLFGLYLLIQMLFYIPASLITNDIFFDIRILILLIVFLLFLYGVFVILLKKVDWVIDVLKLDQGFDDDVDLGSFDEQKISSLAIILIGGFMLVSYFPSFLYNLYMYFKENVSANGMEELLNYAPRVVYFDWAISCINLVLGYLLITNNKFISNWISKKINPTE